MVANFALLFPNGRFTPRWTPIVAVLFGLWTPWVGGPQLILWESAVDFIFGLIFAGIIIYRYRYVFTPAQRQQTKWGLFGIVTAILVIQGDGVLRGTVRAVGGYDAIASFSFYTFPLVRIAALLIPVTLAVAVLRHRLWDIDLTLNRSLVYGSVTIVLGALFFVQFLIVQAVLGTLLGSSQSGIAIAISAVATGALFNPARKRAQHIVDRQLYGFRFDLNELQAAQKTSDIKNPGALTGRTLGAYQVLGVIGKGGMGEVYQGQRNSQTVAIKILPEDLARQDDFRKRFEREAQTLADFDHPNIVKMYDSGQTDGIFYMALEYVEGQELAQVIKQQGLISLEDVLPFVQDFAAALDYAHSKGLVHRDIKPSNIMIRLKADKETQEAVLMDFGIAKIQDARTGITGTGAIGTIDYMAPEQIMAAKTVDHRADIYALGVVLYEMLTGERPFKGSAGQVLFAHLQQPPPDCRDLNDNIPSKAAHALMRAMSKKPDDRFQSVGEFAAALA